MLPETFLVITQDTHSLLSRDNRTLIIGYLKKLDRLSETNSLIKKYGLMACSENISLKNFAFL